MHFEQYQVNTTPEIFLCSETKKALDEIIALIQRCPIPIWPEKSPNQPGKHLLQSVLNFCLAQEILSLGWRAEVDVTKNADGSGHVVDFLRPLSTGKLLVVEVQFGNNARIQCDFEKMHHLECKGLLQLGIIITLTSKLAKITDSGIASFELAVKTVKQYRDTTFTRIKTPVLIIGLASREAADWIDLSKSKVPDVKSLRGKGNNNKHKLVASQIMSGVAVGEICM